MSYCGDWFNVVAIYTAVQSLTGSAQAVAAVMIAKTLPIFVVSPIAGPLVDSFDRKKLLIISDICRSVCAIGLIAAYHAESLTALFVVTFVQVMFAGVVLPSKNAVLPMVVPPDKVSAANAIGGGTWSIMLAFGAALGGLATATLGITAAFAIDGVTFLVSALFFSRLPPLPPVGKRSKEDTSFVEGLRYLGRDRYVLALSTLKPMLSLTTGAVALIPIFGKAFGTGSGALHIGLLYASRGFGALAGSMLVRLVVGDDIKTLRRSILGGYGIIGAGFWFASTTDAFEVVAVGYFIASIGSGLTWVYSTTLLQLEADERYHGRIFSMEFGVVTLVISASSWALTFLVDSGLSLLETIRVPGTVALIPMLIWGGALALRRRNEVADLQHGSTPTAGAPPGTARDERSPDE